MRTKERERGGSCHGHRTAATSEAVDALDAAPPLRYAVSVGNCPRKGATASLRSWRSGGLGLRPDRRTAVERTR